MSTSDEWLQIDTLRFGIPGCCLLRDINQLLVGADQRGDNDTVPEESGTIANAPVDDETDVPLKLTVKGIFDFNGLAHVDERTGIALNIATIRKFASDPTGTGGGTRTATLHYRDLPELSKPVQVRGFHDAKGEGPNQTAATLQLLFPEGMFDLDPWLA